MSRPIASESVFNAISHPTRRRILDLLLRGEKTTGEIVESFHHRWPTISAHLRILRSTGLISQRRIRRQRVYTVHPQGLRPVLEWLEAYRSRSRLRPRRRSASTSS